MVRSPEKRNGGATPFANRREARSAQHHASIHHDYDGMDSSATCAAFSEVRAPEADGIHYTALLYARTQVAAADGGNV